MDEMWQQVPVECFGPESDDAIADAVVVTTKTANHAKLMRLAVIGMWNSQRRERLTAFRTENEQDVHGPVRMKQISEKNTLCFHSTVLYDNRTMLPTALQTLFSEQIHMDRAARLIERIPAIIPLAARVDGIYFAARSEETTNALKALAFESKYDITQRDVYQIKAARVDNLPRNAQNYEYHEIFRPVTGKEWRHYYELEHTMMDAIAEKSGVYNSTDALE